MIWYAYTGDNHSNIIYKLGVDQVNEIMELNRQNKKSAPLEMYAEDLKIETPAIRLSAHDETDFDSLTRFDRKESPAKNRKNKSRRGKNQRNKSRAAHPRNQRNNPKKRKKIHVKKKKDNNRN